LLHRSEPDEIERASPDTLRAARREAEDFSPQDLQSFVARKVATNPPPERNLDQNYLEIFSQPPVILSTQLQAALIAKPIGCALMALVAWQTLSRAEFDERASCSQHI